MTINETIGADLKRIAKLVCGNSNNTHKTTTRGWSGNSDQNETELSNCNCDDREPAIQQRAGQTKD